MNSVKVSVIVPVYNVSRYLENCVNSITDQDFTDFEIILVDDCSPDNRHLFIVELMIVLFYHIGQKMYTFYSFFIQIAQFLSSIVS